MKLNANNMKAKIVVLLVIIFTALSTQVKAQIKIEDILGKVGDLLGKKEILTVRKGFNPVFNLGSLQINKVGILGEQLKGVEVLGNIFSSKGVQDITKLYNTYKTGLVIFKVLAAAGTAVAAYSAVKGIASDNKKIAGTLIPAATSLLTGVITKVLTKKASYKAVDIFNGIVKKKVKDIFSIAPASFDAGIGVFVKL